MSSWTQTVLETEKPEKTIKRITELDLIKDKAQLNITKDGRVYTKNDLTRTHQNKLTTIKDKEFLRLTDLVKRVSIAKCNDTSERSTITLLKLHKNKVKVLDRVKTSRTSDFQYDYFYNKHNFKIMQSIRDKDREYNKYNNLNQLFKEYKELDYTVEDFTENDRKTYHRDRTKDLEPDHTFLINEKSLQQLTTFLNNKKIFANSKSDRKNFLMSTSYKPEKLDFRPTTIPQKEIKEKFSEQKLTKYIKDTSKNSKKFKKEYQDSFFLKNMKGGMNKPPNPNNTDTKYREVLINERPLGEIQCIIGFLGDIELEDTSNDFEFMLLNSYSWLSEQPEKEIKKLEKICKPSLKTRLHYKLRNILD